MKRVFIEQIKVIYWRNKITATTVNLAAGTTVTEVEIFEIKLNGQPLDESVLRQIDREVPYHIIFLLEYEGKFQAWTAYKEATASGNNAFKVGNYYHTDWLPENELILKLDGLNVDTVYENFVRQIAGESLQTYTTDEKLKESVDREEKRKRLQNEIDKLQTKIRKEKQLNKQVELNTDLKLLKKELERMK